jgi:hypothetical protein
MFESTVISAEVKPVLLDLPGVSVRVLHRGNEESGQVVITRIAPGAVIPEETVPNWPRLAAFRLTILNGRP